MCGDQWNFLPLPRAPPSTSTSTLGTSILPLTSKPASTSPDTLGNFTFFAFLPLEPQPKVNFFDGTLTSTSGAETVPLTPNSPPLPTPPDTPILGTDADTSTSGTSKETSTSGFGRDTSTPPVGPETDTEASGFPTPAPPPIFRPPFGNPNLGGPMELLTSLTCPTIYVSIQIGVQVYLPTTSTLHFHISLRSFHLRLLLAQTKSEFRCLD
ncbi:hypothetical protein MN116_000035 [Schistosoma mekongi]|uniref:Uncharacterized protein n=1 Tax=Schistosoma mekongi TaxID=38744 RepID=A0AAE2D3N6_SCHME|nr:hypothetical protein MN116_000035 [Schistosoma mekongi]